MKIQSASRHLAFPKMSVLALIVLGGSLAGQVLAQDLSPEVRDRIKKAAGQVAMGKKVTGEDKIEVRGWGSGWLINPTGLMVTNDHVVNPTHYSEDPTAAFRVRNEMGIIQYQVTLNGGTEDEKSYWADLLYQSESGDLALLQLKDKDGSQLQTPDYLKLFPSKEVIEGQRMAIVGYPKGQQMATSKDKHAPVTISLGNIDSIDRSSSGRIKKFRSDAQAAPGNSGGPAVNLDGELVGVLVEGGADVSVTTGVSSGIIPADVVADMVKASLGLNKLETDLSPFLNLLVDKHQSVFVPGRERLFRTDVIEFPDGDTLEGVIQDKELVWKTAFGEIKIPVELAGYVINDSGTARLLLDGGERLSGDAGNVHFEFKDSRGKESKLKMSNLRSVLFRKRSKPVELPDVDAIVLEADGVKMHLTDVNGKLVFADENRGELTMDLRDIRKVKTRYYKQEVYRTDGSKLTGKFGPQTLKATLAISKSPIEFSLANTQELVTEYANPSEIYDRRVALAMRLQLSDAELVEIADRLDAGELAKASGLLDEMLEPAVFKSKAKPVRGQIEALNGVRLLQQGDYEGAFNAFKGCRKAKIDGVKFYGTGRYEVLKIYPDGRYQGQELSDPKVFSRAARDIATKTVAAAREIIDAYRKAKVTKYSDWKSIEAKSARMEKDLRIAASLILGEAERVLFQMWQFRQKRNWETIKMLLEERERLSSERQQRNAGGKNTRSLTRKINKINGNIQVVFISYSDLRDTMNPIGDGPGYRIDDPNAADFLN